jgi:hypothetical protein
MVIEAPGRPATALDDGTIAKFKQSLAGDVIAPNDPGYDSIRRVWNHDIDRRPRLIAMCVTEEDVVRSIEFARNHQRLGAQIGVSERQQFSLGGADTRPTRVSGP